MSKPTLDDLWDDGGVEITPNGKAAAYCKGRDDLARVILSRLDHWWDECAKQSDWVSEVDQLRDELRSKLGEGK